jgi:hypothetical protein
LRFSYEVYLVQTLLQGSKLKRSLLGLL